MNRRIFLRKLASGIFASAAANIWIPKLVVRPNPQIELIKAIGRGDPNAYLTFTHFIGPVIRNVLTKSDTAYQIFCQDNEISIPLETYF